MLYMLILKGCESCAGHKQKIKAINQGFKLENK